MIFRIPFISVFGEAAEAMVVLATIMFLVFVIAAVLRGRRRWRGPEAPASEDETLARLCGQLEKMERRMENLETLLMDKEHQREPERGQRQ